MGGDQAIKSFINIKPMYEINSSAILASEILLKNQSIRKQYLKSVNKGKEFIIDFFKKKKINYINCDANFILFKLSKNRKKIFNILKKNRIYITEKVNINSLNNFSRITLGPIDVMKRFKNILKKYL